MTAWVFACLILWFILQKRELKRFYEQQDAKRKEVKATQKEVELTNVLNSHQDVVVVFTTEELLIENADDVSSRELDLRIEFSNNRSMDVFGIDLSQLSARQLVLPQFLPCDRLQDSAHISNDKAKITELRKSIKASLWTGLALEDSCLVSLKEILQK